MMLTRSSLDTSVRYVLAYGDGLPYAQTWTVLEVLRRRMTGRWHCFALPCLSLAGRGKMAGDLVSLSWVARQLDVVWVRK